MSIYNKGLWKRGGELQGHFMFFLRQNDKNLDMKNGLDFDENDLDKNDDHFVGPFNFKQRAMQ